MGVFATVTSLVFSASIIISDTDVPYLHRETAIFETLRKMNEVGPFKFVFFAADSE